MKFGKIGELNGSCYVKSSMTSNTILKIQNDDKYCFIWSILVYFHSMADSENGHAKTVSKYRQTFDELNIDGFDFTNGLSGKDMHRNEKSNIFSINIFELNFFQEQNNLKHNSIPIEISKNKTERVVDLLVYKHHCALPKKLNGFSGNHIEDFICRRCSNSYTNENT